MINEYVVTVEADPNLRFEDKYGRGSYVRETWRLNGIIHRQHGPAVTIFHPITNRPIQEEYFKDGKRHRYTGPAIITRDHDTGKIVMAQFFELGQPATRQRPLTLGGA
ncbi:hypothetical protein OOT33_00075 [Sphingobium sp. DEHP117]|uniref:hypothetical protein n=1 Tax=Sphingobium sp. DEHP117 TaxID=2993436 RepID=UPI0027D66CE8|nr:hypothetical protein [Sphingobium sp. DEHP117]MDQ4418843.1 hypothetical protein [Sphingobium sp. DEHP117]